MSIGNSRNIPYTLCPFVFLDGRGRWNSYKARDADEENFLLNPAPCIIIKKTSGTICNATGFFDAIGIFQYQLKYHFDF